MSDDTEEKGQPRTLILMVFSAAIGGTLQYGYNIAIINTPTVYIQSFINETCLERWGVALTVYQVTFIWTLVVSAFSLGGLVGALIAGPMAVFFGRKQALLVNSVFLMASTMLVLTYQAVRSFEMIFLARFLVGVNSGVSMNVQPMYFRESTLKRLRGIVAPSSAVFTALGIVLGQVVGLTDVLGTEPHWPYLLASNAVPSLVQLLVLPWFLKSPRYLFIDRGDQEACAQALQQLRGCAMSGAEMEEILQEQEQVAVGGGARARRSWELFSDCGLRWQLLSIVVTSSAMQLCGNDSVYFYASYVLQEAGILAGQIQLGAHLHGSTFPARSSARNVLPQHGLHLYLHPQLWHGSCWSHCHPAHRGLWLNHLAGSLRDCWLPHVAQPVLEKKIMLSEECCSGWTIVHASLRMNME
ncbi:solute carrier family 2, facilitated glucose transporter member 11-like [Arapaima gigas]